MMRYAFIVLVGVTLCVCAPPSKEPAPPAPSARSKDQPSPASPRQSKDASALPSSRQAENASPLAVELPAVVSTSSIYEDMMSNPDICPGKKIFAQSQYIDSCKVAKMPDVDASPSVDELLCIGLYDRVARLCDLDSRTKTGLSWMPTDTVAFDKQVKSLFPKNGEDTITFCKQWKNQYPPRYEKLSPWVTQLDAKTKNYLMCIKMCISDDERFDPLCSVLVAMDNLPQSTSGQLTTSPDRQRVQDSTQTTKDAATGEKVDKAGGKAAENKAKEERVKAEKKTEIKKTENKIPVSETSDVDKHPKNNDEHAAAPPAQPQSQRQEQAPKHEDRIPEKPVHETTEQAPLPPVSLPEKTEHDEKEKKADETGAVASPPIVQVPQPNANDAGSDKKPDAEPPSVPNPPIGSDDIPSSAEDIKGTENEEEISQNTREQDDVDAGEEVNEMEQPELPTKDEIAESPVAPSEKRENVPRMPSIRNDDDSHFFGYFTVIGVICIAVYVGYHNKQKILAMLVEGRRSRGGRGRRRPSTANYRKLDCTLEEAVTSQCNSNVTHVIY